MKIKEDHLFFVNNLSVRVDINLTNGVHLLLGNNGVGKTTFFDFLKDHKDDYCKESHFAFMDQFPLSVINEIRLRDILTLLNESSILFNLETAQELIGKYEIAYLLDRSVMHFSGGENQIVKFILLLSQDVDYYFLDEPLQYIDNRRVALLKSDIKAISKEKTVIIIEHRAHDLEELNARIITMKVDDEGVLISGD